MFTKLKELNFDPTIIALTRHKNIYFLKKYVKLKEINLTYIELKRNDYDILMVNSDQTWVNVTPNYLPDYGFLKFAENWTIPKFVYGASYPLNLWRYSKEFNIEMGNLLKKFNGISVRELPTINLSKINFGIIPEFVLDPTLLINKRYYLNLIKYYKGDFKENLDYLCVYQLDKNNKIKNFIYQSSLKLNLTIHKVDINRDFYIEDFLKCINISKGVITDSYHGTIFSIIFNKPFISFINNKRGNTRFHTLKNIFNIKNRIISTKSDISEKYNLLKTKLNINISFVDQLKNKSINFLKKNLFTFN